MIDDLEEPEYEVESILRARAILLGRGNYRQALVKRLSEANPTWEPVEFIEETKAPDDFEAKYGPITTNNGPPEDSVAAFVELGTFHKRRNRINRFHGREDQGKIQKKLVSSTTLEYLFQTGN